MEKIHTPSDYFKFLDSDEGKRLKSRLNYAIEKLRPYKIRAYAALAGGLLAAILILWIFKTFIGIIFLIPGGYLFYVMMNKGELLYLMQKEFNEGLNEFIFGKDYLISRCDSDFIPTGFIKGLNEVTRVTKEKSEDFGIFGQSQRLKITRTHIKIEEGKEVEYKKTSTELSSLYVLPSSSLLADKQAFFYFNPSEFNLLKSIGIDFKDKRHFSLTDTELEEWFEVSVGGLKDMFKSNYEDRLLWTKVITPYFETVLKSLVAKYGELYIAIQDGYFFVLMPISEANYKSVQYGKLNKSHYNSNWGYNKNGELKDGKIEPRYAIPYLNRIFLNRIMDAIAYYFFMNHDEVRDDKLEESRQILEYVINSYNLIDIKEMDKEFKVRY